MATKTIETCDVCRKEFRANDPEGDATEVEEVIRFREQNVRDKTNIR